MSRLPIVGVENVLTEYLGPVGIPDYELGIAQNQLRYLSAAKTLAAALQEARDIRHASESTKRRHFSAQGRALFGVNLNLPHQVDRRNLDGLMYAQGSNRLADGSFSEVSLCSWLKQDRLKRLGLTKREATTVHNTITDEILYDVEKPGPAAGRITVHDLTHIWPQAIGLRLPTVGYLYGEHKVMQGIESLRAPDELKDEFVIRTHHWYSERLETS